MTNVSYLLSHSIKQAFLDVYFEGVRNELCETFAGRWGGLDEDAFQRAFSNGQGDDKCVAIFALGANATPEMIIHLHFLLSSSETPRLERWASALCLGRMKEQQAYPLIETLLLDGLSLDEQRRADQPSEEDLHHELWVCAMKRHELVMFLRDWTSPTLSQTLRWGIKKILEIDTALRRPVESYDAFSYVLGVHGAFGALVGLDLPPAHAKTAMIYMALGFLRVQAPWEGNQGVMF